MTCALVRAEAGAARCRRGQVKFSALAAASHVRAHVGPTNARLRLHLALSNTAHTYIRVHNETRWLLLSSYEPKIINNIRLNLEKYLKKYVYFLTLRSILHIAW